MCWVSKLTMLLVAFVVSGAVALAQNKTVSGTIIDDFGEPVLGANVVVVGTTNGATTDIDGNYTIQNVPGNAKLKVTFIGYTPQEVAVNNQSIVNVTLREDVAQLEDVVVVGYGVMKKSDLTGSVASINTENLNRKGAPSVLANLQGASPGVNITQSSGRTGGGMNMEIRGRSSINSNTTPLFVVDGVMFDDIDWLNPQDIDRIDVLKDASSTAIYGSRATAGVVMVTTKSGSNVKGDKASITYDGYYGWSKVARMPDYMDGNQFYNYRFLKFLTPSNAAYGLNPASPNFDMNATTIGQALIQYGDNAYGNDPSAYALKEMLKSGNTYDWPSLVTQDGSQQNHYLGIAGSGEKVNYHIGFGINKEEGTYKGDAKEQFAFKGSVDAKVKDWLKAGFLANLTKVTNEYANDDAIKYAYRMNPFMVPYDADGNLNSRPGNFAALGTASYQFSDQENPLGTMKSTYKERETWRALGNFYLEFLPIKGLSIKTTYAPNFSYYRQGYFAGFTKEDGSFWDSSLSSNSVNYVANRSFSWVWDNVINYNTTINKDHNINLMGLFSSEKSNTEKLDQNYVDIVNENSLWYDLTHATYLNDSDNASGTNYTESSRLSWAFRANYNWKHRYFVTITSRWDGSSKFSEDNRWGWFPSAALAWSVSEEAFMGGTRDWLDNLKMRLSYGVTGNDRGVGNFATQRNLSSTTVLYPFGRDYSTGYVASSVVDKSISWELSKEFNWGLDYTLYGGRVSGSIDLYNKESEDLLFDRPMPLEAGGGTVSTNIGSVRNRGIELSLTTVNFQSNDWRWTTTFTFAHNKNKVLQLNGESDSMIKSANNSLFVGYSANNVYAYGYDGIVSDRQMTVPNNAIAVEKGFTPGDKVTEYDYYYAAYGWTEGQPIISDRNGDGKIDQDDKNIFSSDPKWTGSFSTNLSYKNWDLSMSIYIKQKYKVYSNFYAGDAYNLGDRGRAKMNFDYYIPAGTLINADGVNADGTYINPVYQEYTHYGSFPFPNNGASSGLGTTKTYWDEAHAVTDASYVKVQNITLGYTFPKNLLKSWKCEALRLYATVTNPFVWTDYKGFDPEWANASAKNDGPSIINYQIGASIKF